jgi:NADP-dependent 3-hydroxy acid dehydrogenase YdfG
MGRMIDINIKGVLYGTAAYQYLKNKNRGILLIYHPQQGKSICPEEQFTAVLNLQLVLSLKAYVTGNIRTTSIAPGAVESELKLTPIKKVPILLKFYQSAIPADAIARTIAFAIEQPANVDVNQIVLRPTVRTLIYK